MTNQMEIRYLPTAEKDLEDIFEYILKDNPPAALSLLEEFDQKISILAINPESGMIPKDGRLRKIGYRIVIVRKYLVFYVIKDECVQIRRILHGARQYQFLL